MKKRGKDPKGSTELWSKLWSEPVDNHNRVSEWLKKVKEKLRDTPKQENVIITAKELKWAIARMSNWKAAGPEHVQEFWFKGELTSKPTNVFFYFNSNNNKELIFQISAQTATFSPFIGFLSFCTNTEL